MELSMSGNSLKTFTRCITCLARIGSELVLQSSPSKLELHTLNASRSAYQSISFTQSFFDTYTLSSSVASDSSPSPSLQCSFLLKSVSSVLRTPSASLDHLSILLPSPDSSKIQLTLHCLNGVKKNYWISCNAEPEIQHLSLDRDRFPSCLVVRPRDLSRLLSNFQSSLHEITVIATELSVGPPDAAGDIGGKAVELRSYIDPSKDNSDARLHTQLWIDPAEEFLQYKHVGEPVDITFGMKELKAFLAFCEGCEVDIHLYFEKAGEPILMAPRFGLDGGSSADFDASLVLATMLASQLADVSGSMTDQPQEGPARQSERGPANHTPPPANENTTTDHTKIWSELSGSAARVSQGNRENQAQREGNLSSTPQNGTTQMAGALNAPHKPLCAYNANNTRRPMETDQLGEPDEVQVEVNPYSQHHPSNWVGAGDDDDEEDEDDEELYVQSTPHYFD